MNDKSTRNTRNTWTSTCIAATFVLAAVPAWAQSGLPVEVISEFHDIRPANLTVTPQGRIIVSMHPLDNAPMRMMEVTRNGSQIPFPTLDWADGPENGEVGFSSNVAVDTDDEGVWWMLDMGGELQGPQLVSWDTVNNHLEKVIPLPENAYLDISFLQDMALDHERGKVYIADMTSSISPSMTLGAMPTRPALLVRVTDVDGCFGWGEVWANFPPRANLHKAHLIEDVIAARLKGVSFTEPGEVISWLRESLSSYFLHVGQQQVFEHLLAGLDVALWDLALRGAGESFAEHRQLDERRAETYASSINRHDLERLLPLHAGLGQRAFKLKLGFDDATDLDFVRRATVLQPPGTRLMVDSNQAWSLQQALKMLEAIEPLPRHSAR